MKNRLHVLVATSVLTLAFAALAVPAGAEDGGDVKQPFVTDKTPPNSPSAYECTASGAPAADVLLDCDDPYPNNEPNVAVDPDDPLHMVASSNDYGSCCDQYYTTFESAGVHDVADPVTRSEAFVVTSAAGTDWSAPTMVDPDPNESWFPWIDVAPDGTVGVLYNDRRGGDTYVAELAEGAPGSFSTQVVSQALSHPNDSAFFKARIPDCEDCARFHGDYLGLDYGSDGVANMAWTDMRDTSADFDGYQQFVYFARR